MTLALTLLGLVPSPLIRLISGNQWRYPILRRICVIAANLLRNGDGTIQRGVGKGLKLNVGPSQSAFLLGTHEPLVQKALANFLSPGMTMFDVGANVGYYATLSAKLVGESGSVVCFEPLPENARQIEYNARLNGFHHLTVRHEALGSEDGSAAFLRSAEPTWGKLRSVGGEPDKYIGQTEVEIRKLDSLLQGAAIRPPDLIKIDVEGAEHEVLTGAAQTINSARPVLMIELHGTNRVIADDLAQLGYEAIAVGRETTLVDSPWDAYVLAAPQEQADRVDLIRQFVSSRA